MNRRTLQLVLAIVSPIMFAWFADVSWAQGGPITQGPVTDLWNTGVDSGGIVLPNGTVGDPHYTLVSSPAGPIPDVVATSVGGWPILPAGGWLLDDSQSAWIGPNYRVVNTFPGLLLDPAPSGTYDYETTFTLSTAGSYTITGQWFADSHGYDILLDGGATGNYTLPGTPPANPIDYAYWTPFTITGTGLAGSTHTLDFLVDRTATTTDTSGLRVEFTPAPEPSTLVLLSVGAIGLLTYAWRKRR